MFYGLKEEGETLDIKMVRELRGGGFGGNLGGKVTFKT
jgi:hypothetical protein